MFLRLLFVLLIALNIAVGAWLLLGQDDVHGRAATDAGVPELHLLSERPPAPSSAPAPATPATSMAAATPTSPASSAIVTFIFGLFGSPSYVHH